VNRPGARQALAEIITGFPPISQPYAHTLILGSMPSVESLRKQQYYAHPRNGFWPIVSDLFGIEASRYEDRAQALADAGLAIWDVMQACTRPGSLDADIDKHSIVPNDFAAFYTLHTSIGRVFFNGAKAESVYLRMVLPGLTKAKCRAKCGHPASELHYQRLPSTSPAHAAMNLAEKMQAWRTIADKPPGRPL
jgi:TDG/mug DNA glycosylase family protein